MNRTEVLALFETIEAAGVRPPYEDAEGSERTVGVWLAVLGAHAADAAHQAVLGHLAGRMGRWWPKPAELLERMPRLVGPEPVAVEEPQNWPGHVLMHLDSELRIRLMDEACRWLIAQIERPCGQPKCPVTCDVCNAAMLRHADEPARVATAPEPVPLVEPPAEYEDARERYGPVDDDEVVDQGASW